MQNTAWASLFQYIPSSLHSAMMLGTRAGVEIQMQGILRVDHEFVVIRGRLSGSQDGGRLLFIPYAQIDYLGYQREVKDAEFHATFDGLEMPAPDAVQTVEIVEEVEVADAPLAPTPLVKVRSRQVPCIKSAVLERFRSRGVAPSAPAPPG